MKAKRRAPAVDARRRMVAQSVRRAAHSALPALGKTTSRKTVPRTVFRSLTLHEYVRFKDPDPVGQARIDNALQTHHRPRDN